MCVAIEVCNTVDQFVCMISISGAVVATQLAEKSCVQYV